MLITLFSVALFLIFLFLGGIHFYWLFGGKWAVESVIPTKSSEPNSQPVPKIATLIVAFGLTSFGLLYLNSAFLHFFPSFNYFSYYLLWIIPSIFIIRAIGEFKYVGFFKKVKNTKFAKADTTLFSPKCLAIGLMGLYIIM